MTLNEALEMAKSNGHDLRKSPRKFDNILFYQCKAKDCFASVIVAKFDKEEHITGSCTTHKCGDWRVSASSGPDPESSSAGMPFRNDIHGADRVEGERKRNYAIGLK